MIKFDFKKAKEAAALKVKTHIKGLVITEDQIAPAKRDCRFKDIKELEATRIAARKEYNKTFDDFEVEFKVVT